VLAGRISEIVEKQDRDTIIGAYSRKSEIVILLKILINYCKQNHSDLDTLFKIVSVANIRISQEQSFIRRFLRSYISEHFSLAEQNQLFLYYIDSLARQDVSLEQKINSGFMVIYPIILRTNRMGQLRQVLNKPAIESFCHLLMQINSKKVTGLVNRLVIEVIQLTFLVMSYLKEDI